MDTLILGESIASTFGVEVLAKQATSKEQTSQSTLLFDLWNVDELVLDYTASHIRRLYSSHKYGVDKLQSSVMLHWAVRMAMKRCALKP
jgi:hypothetical protein